jgi:hypothetical protein
MEGAMDDEDDKSLIEKTIEAGRERYGEFGNGRCEVSRYAK